MAESKVSEVLGELRGLDGVVRDGEYVVVEAYFDDDGFAHNDRVVYVGEDLWIAYKVLESRIEHKMPRDRTLYIYRPFFADDGSVHTGPNLGFGWVYSELRSQGVPES